MDVERVALLACKDAKKAREMMGVHRRTMLSSLACLEQWLGVEELDVFHYGAGFKWFLPTHIGHWLGFTRSGTERLVEGFLEETEKLRELREVSGE